MNLSHLFGFVRGVEFDDHTEPHYDVTASQLSFAFIWACCTVLWLFQYGTKSSRETNGAINRNELDSTGSAASETEKLKLQENNVENNTSDVSREKVDIEKGNKFGDNIKEGENEKQKEVKTFSTLRPPPTFGVFLKHVSLFGLLLFFFYLCDYRKVCKTCFYIIIMIFN